jgi:hypothetical protein
VCGAPRALTRLLKKKMVVSMDTQARKRRPSAALLISMFALFAALGGTGVAQDAVDSAVKKIKGKQIASNAIKSKHVKDGSLRAKDFKAGQLPAGAQGPKGETGDTGPAGRSALSELRTGETVRGTIYHEFRGAPANGKVGVGQSLPIPAPVALTTATVRVKTSDDPGNLCAGSYSDPTAPPGNLCVYINSSSNTTGHLGFVPLGQATKYGFNVSANTTTAGSGGWFQGAWAYTAP